jgi:hypothetical protein
MNQLREGLEMQKQKLIHALFTAGAKDDNYYDMTLSELELAWDRHKQ